jgi:hypothetical protein
MLRAAFFDDPERTLGYVTHEDDPDGSRACVMEFSSGGGSILVEDIDPRLMRLMGSAPELARSLIDAEAENLDLRRRVAELEAALTEFRGRRE